MSKHIPWNKVQREQEMQVVRKVYGNYKKAKELEEKVKEILKEKANETVSEDNTTTRQSE